MSNHVPSRLGRFIKSTLLPFQLAVCTTIFLNDSLLEIACINGRSMHPTLSPRFSHDGSRDYIIWKKFHPTKDLQRGDVVLFHSLQNPETLSVKRVIAVGGDTVVLDVKRRPEEVVNGRGNPLARSWDVMYAKGKGRTTVPDGHVWVEGDNFRATYDSHAYGPISRSLILGKAVGLLWPLRQIGARPWQAYTSGTRVIPRVEAGGGGGGERGGEEKWWEPN